MILSSALNLDSAYCLLLTLFCSMKILQKNYLVHSFSVCLTVCLSVYKVSQQCVAWMPQSIISQNLYVSATSIFSTLALLSSVSLHWAVLWFLSVISNTFLPFPSWSFTIFYTEGLCECHTNAYLYHWVTQAHEDKVLASLGHHSRLTISLVLDL